MNAENIARLEAVVEHLGELLEEVAFVGGATVELWITDQAAPEFRPTADVDVVVEIATLVEFHRFEEKLRERRFEHDQESGAICRFKHRDAAAVLLDVMPTEAAILGFENRWQSEAFPHATDVPLPSGRSIRAIPPAYLLATKLEAFKTRGNDDFLASRDFADIVTLVDGREELAGEVAASARPLREYVSEELQRLAADASFKSGLQGALLPEAEAQARVALVVEPRISAVIGAAAPDLDKSGTTRSLR